MAETKSSAIDRPEYHSEEGDAHRKPKTHAYTLKHSYTNINSINDTAPIIRIALHTRHTQNGRETKKKTYHSNTSLKFST